MKKLGGVIVPVATPLRHDESPDENAIGRLVEYLLAAGVHGLFANGSMGGFAFHSDASQDLIIATVCRAAGGRVPVLAGVSDTSVRRVLERIGRLRGLPVDAAVVLPPYYFLYSPAEITRFFNAIADHAHLPIVLYENPRHVPLNSITASVLAELVKHPNIAGIKNSSSDDAQWRTLLDLDLPRERFSMICGAEKRMGDGLRAGFDGLTGGFHNVLPELPVAMYQAAQRQDWDLLHHLQLRLNRAYGIFETAGGWRGLEVAFQVLGIATKAAVHPFDDSVSTEQRNQIEAILAMEKNQGATQCFS